MNMKIEELKQAGAELAPAERAELAEFLVSTLDEFDTEWTKWRGELDRRLRELRTREVHGIPAEDVLRLRQCSSSSRS